jgi:hypothetical protein
MQYSDDLRQKLVDAWKAGYGTQAELAEWFGVSLRWVEKVLRCTVPSNAWTCRAKKDTARQRTRHPSRQATACALAAEAPPSGPAATDLCG